MTALRGLDDDNSLSGWTASSGSNGPARLLACYRRLTDSLGQSAGLSRFYLDSVEEAAAVLGTDRALLYRYDSNDPDYIRVVAGTGPLARLEGAVLPARGSFEGSVLGRGGVANAPSLEGPEEYFRTAEHRRHVGPAMAIGLGTRGEASGVLLAARAPGAEPFPSEYGATLSEVAALVSSGIAIAEHFEAARGGRRAVDAWREERYARQWLDSYRGIFESRGEAAFRLAPSGSIEWGTTADLVLGILTPPPDTMTGLLARLESEERIVAQSALRQISSDSGSAALSVTCTLEVAPGRKRPFRLSIWKNGHTGSFLGVIAEAAPPAGTFAPPAEASEPIPSDIDPPATDGGTVGRRDELGASTSAIFDGLLGPHADLTLRAEPEPMSRIEPVMAMDVDIGAKPAITLDRVVEPDTTIGAGAGGSIDSELDTSPEPVPEAPTGPGALSWLAAEIGSEPVTQPAARVEPADCVVEVAPNGDTPVSAPWLNEPAETETAAIAPELGLPEPAAPVAVSDVEAPAPPRERESEPFVLTDFHCHLVPGVDDGAVDEAEAGSALDRVYAAGVRHLIVTPHLRLSVLRTGEPIVLTRGFERLVDLAREKYPDLRISRGAEVMLDDLEVDFTSPSTRLAGTRFVLMEFTGFWIPPRSAEILSRVMERGFVPVVAHPERYANGSAREAMAWRDAGARLQVNCGALLGQYGPAARNRAWQLLSVGGADYLASDYHARGVYPVEACVRLLESYGGKAQAELMLKVNPSRLARGEDPLPVQAINRPTSFLRRLFR